MAGNFQYDNGILIRPDSQVNLTLIVSYKFDGDIQLTIPGITPDRNMLRFFGSTLKSCGEMILNMTN